MNSVEISAMSPILFAHPYKLAHKLSEKDKKSNKFQTSSLTIITLRCLMPRELGKKAEA